MDELARYYYHGPMHAWLFMAKHAPHTLVLGIFPRLSARQRMRAEYVFSGPQI